MEIAIIVLSALLIIVGIIGSLVPVLPGPPIGFSGLLILSLLTSYTFTTAELVVVGVLTGLVTVLDYVIQIYGVKKYGGGKMAINGTVVGFIVGLLFGPLGMILGPFLGAYGGALIEKGKTENQSPPIKIALGAFLGFLGGTVLKMALCFYMAYMYVDILFLN
jgi:hypothetical protein